MRIVSGYEQRLKFAWKPRVYRRGGILVSFHHLNQAADDSQRWLAEPVRPAEDIPLFHGRAG